MLRKNDIITDNERMMLLDSAKASYEKLLVSNNWEDVIDSIWAQVEFIRFQIMDEETKRNLPQ
tara:strand:- start:209 stop:397 length:189 start_codon:yes stop_codon:yes gene_type:complete